MAGESLVMGLRTHPMSGEMGKKLTEIVSAAIHDLPLPKYDSPVAKTAGGIQPGQTLSNQKEVGP
jgi:hypothetical protein